MNNCEFSVLKWDKEAISVLGNLVECMKNVTEIFKGSGIEMGAMFKLEGGASLGVSGGKFRTKTKE